MKTMIAPIFFNSLLAHFTLSILLLCSPSFASRPFKKIYVFGDSYTDTGNGNSSTGPNIFRHVSELPYGMTYFHHPTNRYSDGRLVIDFVATSLSMPFIPPYLNKGEDTSYGVNFAVSGCTAIRHSFFVRNNLTNNIVPQSLGTQLVWFKRFLRGTGCINATYTPLNCKAVFDDALVWVGAIGANDYNYAWGTSVTSKTIQRLAIKSQTEFLEALLNMGAKFMVVQGLPATGCLTLSLAVLTPTTDRDDIGCAASKNKESYDHNIILQTKLQKLQHQFPETVIVFGDDWNLYREVFKNAAKYGFTERFKCCCGNGGGLYNFNMTATCGAPSTSACKNPSQYMGWDGLHVTEGLNKVAAKLFLDGKYSQPSFKDLLSKKAKSN